jgi:hypothetical protein
MLRPIKAAIVLCIWISSGGALDAAKPSLIFKATSEKPLLTYKRPLPRLRNLFPRTPVLGHIITGFGVLYGTMAALHGDTAAGVAIFSAPFLARIARQVPAFLSRHRFRRRFFGDTSKRLDEKKERAYTVRLSRLLREPEMTEQLGDRQFQLFKNANVEITMDRYGIGVQRRVDNFSHEVGTVGKEIGIGWGDLNDRIADVIARRASAIESVVEPE